MPLAISELFDPESEEGVERIEFLRDVLRDVLGKLVEGAPQLREGRRIKILDLCCGMGVSSAALIRAARDLGLDPDLIAVDRSPELVERARRFLAKELGREPRAVARDALELVEELREPLDVVAMLGFSSVHFDPWRMAKLCSSVARVLEPHGLFLIEEIDRLYSYVSKGLRSVDLLRFSKGRAILVLHERGGYDLRRALVKLRLLELPGGEVEEVEIHPWSVAGLAAMLWMLFSEVELREENGITYISAWRPRKNVAEELAEARLPSWASS